MNCLTPGCEREAKSRGLCSTHYNSLSERIAQGKDSWKQAEAEGRSMPVVVPPRGNWELAERLIEKGYGQTTVTRRARISNQTYARLVEAVCQSLGV